MYPVGQARMNPDEALIMVPKGQKI